MKTNEGTINPTFDEPKSDQAIDFNDGFEKEMLSKNIHLNEINSKLIESDYKLKKKIFSLPKMESLVFSDPKLTAVYNEMSEEGKERYGYHYNETILNIIFNDYVLNSAKYIQKYKMAVPKEKKRRDKSGIDQAKKSGEMDRKKEIKKDNKSVTESTISSGSGAYEIPFSRKENIKNITKEIKNNEQNDVEVSEIGKEKKAHDKKKTTNKSASWTKNKPTNKGGVNENEDTSEEEIIDETTSASSAAGSNSYVGYAGPAAWSKDEKPKKNKPYWDGGNVIQESNYLIDPTGFEKYINMLNEDHLNTREDKINFIVDANNKIQPQNPIDAQGEMTFRRVLNNLMDDTINTMYMNCERKLKQMGVLNEDHLDNRQDKIEFIKQGYKELFDDDPLVTSGEIDHTDVFQKLSNDILNMIYGQIEKQYKNTTTNESSMIDNQEDSMKMKPPINHDTNIPTGTQSSGPMSENSMNDDLLFLENINNELNLIKMHNDKLNKILEDRKPSTLVMKDRLGNENEKNFKSDLKHSGTKEIIDITKQLEYKDQQTDVLDPQKLSKDIEKNALKTTKGGALKNVGDSTNDNGDEIPKRNATDEEMDEIDLYRKGLGDVVFDNKPSKRFEERMKRDMGDVNYEKRQKKIEFEAQAPMYNKDTQPVMDGIEKDQFDKYKSKWANRMGVDENLVTGKYKNDFGQTKFVDFNLGSVNEATKINETWKELNLNGIGNVYTNKHDLNENVMNVINSHRFYTDGNDVFVMKIKKENISENKNTKQNKELNEQFNKLKHLSGYDPKTYIDTKKNKI
jgi:hypothetical protein